ncbi:MAG: deoxyribose-phosphate aldolase [Chloroflexi bacterium]|nr:MAG: deoxyribose-phosphate aldolase [Chloroflexota bacterium]
MARAQSARPLGQSGAAASRILTPAEAARLIDHTLLKPDATEAQVRQLCAEAKQYGFASVCVNPTWVGLCRDLLVDSPVKVCSVAGFALGATLPEVKAFEAERAILSGAHEVDMVINVGRLKSGDNQTVFQDIAAVVSVAHRLGAVLKAILETALLSEEEKIAACALAQAAGADFVKTSTGFNGGATVADVALMRRVVGPAMGVKAAGGIRTAAELRAMVAAGANRIGASAGVKIMQELEAQSAEGESEPEAGREVEAGVEPSPETGDAY